MQRRAEACSGMVQAKIDLGVRLQVSRWNNEETGAEHIIAWLHSRRSAGVGRSTPGVEDSPREKKA